MLLGKESKTAVSVWRFLRFKDERLKDIQTVQISAKKQYKYLRIIVTRYIIQGNRKTLRKKIKTYPPLDSWPQLSKSWTKI